MNTYRVWISRQKETTLVTEQFADITSAKLALAGRYNTKTFNVVAQRVSPAELAAIARAEADPDVTGSAYRRGRLTLAQYRTIHNI
jgi:hypothetical protein